MAHKHRPVNSSVLRSVSYDHGARELEVVFASTGKAARYAGVSPEMFERMMRAGSIGGHFCRHIKGKIGHSY